MPLAMPKPQMLLSLRYTSVVSLFGLLFALNSCKHCLPSTTFMNTALWKISYIPCPLARRVRNLPTRSAAGARSGVSKTASAITGWNNSGMIIGIRHIGRSPSAGAGMRGLNIPRKIKNGGMAATDAVIPPLYFLRVDQLMKNDFLCPVTDIVHMAHPFHLVRCF